MCQFSTTASMWMSRRRRRVKFCSSADPPLEVVSEAEYWWTEPASLDKPAARIKSMTVWQSFTQLNKEKCPTKQRYVTKQLNHSNCNCLWQLIWGKHIPQLYVVKCLSSCLSYRLFVTFLPEMCVCDEKKQEKKTLWWSALQTETSGTFPPENSLPPVSDRVRQHPVYWWWSCNYVI